MRLSRHGHLLRCSVWKQDGRENKSSRLVIQCLYSHALPDDGKFFCRVVLDPGGPLMPVRMLRNL